MLSGFRHLTGLRVDMFELTMCGIVGILASLSLLRLFVAFEIFLGLLDLGAADSAMMEHRTTVPPGAQHPGCPMHDLGLSSLLNRLRLCDGKTAVLDGGSGASGDLHEDDWPFDTTVRV